MPSTSEPRLRVTRIPHTHWDREWYEPFAVFSQLILSRWFPPPQWCLTVPMSSTTFTGLDR
jgi:hypothetical protein